ncbi:MAG: 4-(cytidine 5'-diphospho)-2-C-methyl-D-erythritol kinase [Peptococcales bacterium]|jgi:4-diphosphocytidyl-2-C-methyl-D-erythritol kinase
MKVVKVRAYAKINLFLDVLRKRADGYHEVEMIMQGISLHDIITIQPALGITIVANSSLIPLDERNLAFQAARLIIDKFPGISGVKINIDKNIPVEAGLAGGSTDAAAVILGMNKIYNLNLTNADMIELGELLGSDVPFCTLGSTALASGRGEIITETALCPLLWVVLVKPPFGVKTKDVYANFDSFTKKHKPSIKSYIKALEVNDISYLLSNTFNALEESTFKLYPSVQLLKEQLINLGAKNILMSGSGPTIFTLFSSQEEAQKFAQTVKDNYDYQVLLTHTITKENLNERIEVL